MSQTDDETNAEKIAHEVSAEISAEISATSCDTSAESTIRGASLLPERLPRPTAWPAAVALGITLSAFGVVTSAIVSIFGLAIFLLGAGGWFRELRDDQLQ